jgi:hypothetical protein
MRPEDLGIGWIELESRTNENEHGVLSSRLLAHDGESLRVLSFVLAPSVGLAQDRDVPSVLHQQSLRTPVLGEGAYLNFDGPLVGRATTWLRGPTRWEGEVAEVLIVAYRSGGAVASHSMVSLEEKPGVERLSQAACRVALRLQARASGDSPRNP